MVAEQPGRLEALVEEVRAVTQSGHDLYAGVGDWLAALAAECAAGKAAEALLGQRVDQHAVERGTSPTVSPENSLKPKTLGTHWDRSAAAVHRGDAADADIGVARRRRPLARRRPAGAAQALRRRNGRPVERTPARHRRRQEEGG